MQHAQETATETEAQGVGRLGFIEERGVVQRQLFQRLPKVLEVLGIDGEQSRIHLRLHLGKARQGFHGFGIFGVHDGIAHRSAADVLDACHHVAYLACQQTVLAGPLGGEASHFIHHV